MDKKIIINCVGDSVTEGMAMYGHHVSDYGASSYPARLNTILKDNGYTNVTVNNYGHGGECFPEVAARMGGVAVYISEELRVEDGVSVSLGKRKRDNGKTTNTKLRLCYADESGEDMFVYFTQMSHDTNPVTIDGVKYIMSVENDNENVIRKMYGDHLQTVIPKGTLLFTANNRNPDINIIYAGANDGNNFSMKKFAELGKLCASVNGGKYIIIGSTHPIFEQWPDIKGDTREEKYANYKRACYESFGIHFIDLYDEFSRHGLDIALEAGYFADKTDAELDIIRKKLSEHIIPAELVYDKKSENDVHLCKEGYHIMAVLIFNRLKLLGYI